MKYLQHHVTLIFCVQTVQNILLMLGLECVHLKILFANFQLG